MHFQGYGKDIALLKAAYFSNLSNPETVKHDNIFFVSDLNIGYSVVKSTILQTNANYNSACKSDRKNVFVFRLKLSSNRI